MPRSRFLCSLFYVAVFLLVASAAAYVLGVRFNLTPSLAPGLYVRTAGTGTVGQMVTFCPPESIAPLALERGYIHRGSCPGGVEPLGKYVLAVEGDTLTLAAEGILVNGEVIPNSAIQPQDRTGHPLPHPPFGTHLVGPDSFFAFSGRHPRSFDSRYFGSVPRSAVRSAIRPLWTAD